MTNPGEQLDQLLGDWFDEGADGTDRSSLTDVASLPEATSEQAADAVLVHGLLSDLGRRDPARDEQRINAVMETIRAEGWCETDAVSLSPRSRRTAIISAIAAVAACLLLMFSLSGNNRANAALVSLEKIIEASNKSFDRSYRIFVVEEYDQNKQPRKLRPMDRRRPDRIDGAVLHVRGPNEFVFVRRLPDGQQRVSGCDGRESWAFREEGPVHVSADLFRFRSGLPGREQDLPFVNLHTHLRQLRVGYDIELTGEPVESTGGRELSQLVATRKSHDVRGPNQVAIVFAAETGVAYSMTLDGLPRRGGGPKSVRLELLNPDDLGQTDFGPKFFSRDSHHEPLREVRYEEAR